MKPKLHIFATIRLIGLCALLLTLCACEQSVEKDSKPPYDNLLKEQFDGSTFPAAGWTVVGPGTLTQDTTFGAPEPSLRLDSTGVQSGLISPPFEATAHFSVKIAIDPAAASGASATFELRNAATNAVVASVAVEENQITYVMGASTPVVQSWTTDGAFHEFEFQGSNSSVSGGHWWLRDGTTVASYASPTGATDMTVGLLGPSSGDAWFDDVWVHHHLAYPG